MSRLGLIMLMCAVAAFVSAHDDYCNMKKVIVDSKSPLLLAELPNEPIVYTFSEALVEKMSAQRRELLQLTEKNTMISLHGDDAVTLSSSNAYSHDKVQFTLAQYIASFNNNAPLGAANETFYLFGNNYDGVWRRIAELYHIPHCGGSCEAAGAETAGLGGAQSGVVFHFHGPGFAEVLHGRKEWFFYPPGVEVPGFDPNMTMVQWAERYHAGKVATEDAVAEGAVGGFCDNTDCGCSAADAGEGSCSAPATDEAPPGNSATMEKGFDSTYMLPPTQRDDAAAAIDPVRTHLRHCVLHPGELLYFPSQWMHGTLNLDPYNVFVSTFIDLQLLARAKN